MTYLERIRYEPFLFDIFEQNLAEWKGFLSRAGSATPSYFYKSRFDNLDFEMPPALQRYWEIAKQFPTIPLLGIKEEDQTINLLPKPKWIRSKVHSDGLKFAAGMRDGKSTSWRSVKTAKDTWIISESIEEQVNLLSQWYIEYFLMDWAHCHLSTVWIQQETRGEFDKYYQKSAPIWNCADGSYFWFNSLGIIGYAYQDSLGRESHWLAIDRDDVYEIVGRPVHQLTPAKLFLRTKIIPTLSAEVD